MGLAVKSFIESLRFIKKYPVSIVFMLAINIVYLLASVISTPLTGRLSIPAGMSDGIVTRVAQYSWTNIMVFVVTAFVSILLSLIQLGAFPVLVSGCLKNKGSGLMKDAVSRSIKNIVRLFVVTLIMSVIAIALLTPSIFLNTGLAYLNMSGMMFWASVLIIGMVALLYISARLWLAFPILMLENKKAVESLRSSWKMTRGKVLSVLVTFILMFLLLIVLYVIAADIAFIDPTGYIGFLVGFSYGVFSGALAGVLSTIYYFNLKKRRQ